MSAQAPTTMIPTTILLPAGAIAIIGGIVTTGIIGDIAIIGIIVTGTKVAASKRG